MSLTKTKMEASQLHPSDRMLIFGQGVCLQLDPLEEDLGSISSVVSANDAARSF